MRRLSILIIIGVLSLLSSCSSDDNSTGARVEKEWIAFVQKHLIGDWTPKSIEVKPLVGSAIYSTPYPNKPNCKSDFLQFQKDFTGSFNQNGDNCELKETKFKWNHRLGELIFTLENGVEIKTLLLKKSESQLVLAIPVLEVLPVIQKIYPAISEVDPDTLKLLHLRINLEK